MKQGRTRRFFRVFGWGVAAVLLVLIVFGILHREELVRLYHVIVLFEPDVVVENFRGMDAIFFDTRTVHAGDDVWELERAETVLPDTYEYNGGTKSIDDFLEETWTTGMIVIVDDAIVYEEYFLGGDETSRHISWSVAKSFVSAMMGIAVDEGYIESIEDPATKYVPFLIGSGYDGVKIKDILQMSSGVRFDETYADFFSDINRMGRVIALNTSLADFIATLKSEREPGTYNHYVSMDTQVLGMVLTAATGKNLAELLEEYIWVPVGMEADAYWLVDGDGAELAFGGLNAVLRDYARFGLLYLHGGRRGDDQIVPVDWVEASVTPDAPHLLPGDNPASDWVMGYGYQWWIPENPEGDFMAIGIYNQFIYVNPDRGVVIAKNSAYADYDIDGEEKELESVAVFRAIAHALAEK
ncbi:MAG: serine hydrolase [Deltaproteobacteria bacterium]|nr:serine hydrolase [Candidatus Zymogenaceae bacterium]